MKNRNIVAKKYFNLFKKFKFISLPSINKNNLNAYHLFPIRINFKKFKISKNNFLKKMKTLFKINLQIHYTPTYRFRYYNKPLKNDFNKYPNTEKFFNESFSLPIYPNLKENEQKYIVSSIIKCLNLK